MAEKFVEIIKLKTASDFIDSISHTSKYFENSPPDSWLFRGLSNAKHTLLPYALRPGAFDQFSLTKPTTTEDQIFNEFKLIREFVETADRSGLTLPEDSQFLRSTLSDLRTRQRLVDYIKNLEDDTSWPPKEILSITGLAQHYGIPTRLLDWSYNPLVAMYFAAIGATNTNSVGNSNEKTIAVWAFNKSVDIAVEVLHFFKKQNRTYEIVRVPYATNPNIQAQQGIFTIARRSIILDEQIDRKSFDDILYDYGISRDWPVNSPIFIRFELGWENVPQLLLLLAKYGISASTIFPGYTGVVETVKEKLWYWRKIDNA